MKKKQLTDTVRFELLQGDIAAQQDIQAVVNAANAQLQPGGGVAGAIHRTAGPGLVEETRLLAPIQPGDAVITGGYNLPNDYIIHCLGPVYGKDKPEAVLLARCYEKALRLAEENDIESIAFPAISTGAFGYPAKEAARIALQTIKENAYGLSAVRLIRLVLWDDDSMNIHEAVMRDVLE
jgi:O-acetyl-ADP-ribose deacetylase (regulator of RNase III)